MATDNQWRQDITRRVEELGAQNQATAIILERIQNTQANQAADITEIRSAPATARASISTVTQIVGTSITTLGFLMSTLGCLLSPLIAGGIAIAGSLITWAIIQAVSK